MSLAVYHEVQAATTAERAVWASLLDGQAPQLCVLRKGVLDVYAVGSADGSGGGSLPPRAQLRVLCSLTLHEPAADVVAVTLSGRAAAAVTRGVPRIQALLLTLREARVAVVALDPFTLQLSVLALVNLEEGGLGPGCSSVTASKGRVLQSSALALSCELRVDPDGRCAAFQPYDDQLAVLPFVGDVVAGMGGEDDDWAGLDAEAEDDAAVAPVGGAPVGGAPPDESARVSAKQDRFTRVVLRQPFVVGLEALEGAGGSAGSGAAVAGVAPLSGGLGLTDIAFLHGFPVSPVAALLVHPRITSAARAASLMHTGALVAVTLDCTTRTALVQWRREGLPHDAHSLVALPSPIGGVLIASPSALLYYNAHRYAGLALNAFAAYTVDSRGRCLLDTNATHDAKASSGGWRGAVTLDAGSRFAVLSPTSVLAIDASGAALLITLHLGSGAGGGGASGDVHHLTIAPMAVRLPPASCVAFLPCASPALAIRLAGAAGASARAAPSWAWGLLFLACRYSDSVLVVCGSGKANAPAAPAPSAPPCRTRNASGVAAAAPSAAASRAIVEDDESLYAVPATASSTHSAAAVLAAASAEDEELYGTGGHVSKRARTADADSGAVSLASLAALGDSSDDDPVVAVTRKPSTAVGAAAAQVPSTPADDDAFLYGAPAAAGGSKGASASHASGAASTLTGEPPLGSFELVCFPVDSLPCLGPITASALARSTRLVGDDDEEPSLAPPPTELVLGCGRGAGAGVAVVHRALRPIVASQLRLAGCTGVWFLQHTHAAAADGDTGVVLIATSSGTRVFAVGDGIGEVPQPMTGLAAGTSRTLAAGVVQRSAGGGSVFVQATAEGLRVCDAAQAQAHLCTVELALPLREGGLGSTFGMEGMGMDVDGSSARAASIAGVDFCGPYTLVRLSDGSLRLVTVHISGSATVATVDSPLLFPPPPTDAPVGLPRADAVTAACLYEDTEQALGDLGGGAPPGGARYFVFVCRRSGQLDVLALPSWRCVFSAHALHLAPSVLCGADSLPMHAPRALPRSFVREVAVVSVPGHVVGERPSVALVALTSRDDVLAYTLRHPSPTPPPLTAAMLAADAAAAASPAPSTIPRRNDARRRAAASAAAAAVTSPTAPPSGAPNSALVAARVADDSLPLHLHRAAVGPRFLRVEHIPQVTRVPSADGEAPPPAALEGAWQGWAPPRLRAFSDVSGWAGLAVLTPQPLWLVTLRGTLTALPFGVPDVAGSCGAASLPGDVLFSPNLVAAFTPFHAPNFLPHGFIVAHQGHVQFGTLPRPLWAAARSVNAPDDPPAVHPRLAVGADGCPLPIARGEWALALAASGTPASEPDASSAGVAQSGGGVGPAVQRSLAAPLPADPAAAAASALVALTGVANVLPGPAHSCVFFRHHVTASLEEPLPPPCQGPPFSSGIAGAGQAAVSKLCYLEAASAKLGGAALIDWSRRRAEAAIAASAQVPLPPTATQLQCCVSPLFAAALALPVARNWTAECDALREEMEAEGGEYTQVDYGEHVDVATMPLKPSPGGADPSWDALVRSFSAAGIAELPPIGGIESRVALLFGSKAEPGAWGVAHAWGAKPANAPALSPDGPQPLIDYLLPHERVLCIAEAPLAEGGAGARAEPALIVGTGFVGVRAEDARARGRILVFRIVNVIVASVGGGSGDTDDSVPVGSDSAAGHTVAATAGLATASSEDAIDVVAEAAVPDAPVSAASTDAAPASTAAASDAARVAAAANVRVVTQPRLKLVWEEELKGPVVALGPLVCHDTQGREVRHLIVSTGRRLEVHEWQPGLSKLRMIAFWEAYAWAGALCTVREYVLIGDAARSLALFRWREEDHQLLLLALDKAAPAISAPVSSVSMLVADKQLSLLALDAHGNASLYEYAPKEAGQSLALRGDFRLGSLVAPQAALRSRVAIHGSAVGAVHQAAARRRHASVIATNDGAIGVLVPLPEADYKRLATLSRVLGACTPHGAGANPRLGRTYSCANAPYRHRLPGRHYVLDGCLLGGFNMLLAAPTQAAIAAAAGTTQERVLSTLRTIDLQATLF